jgi:hypothetical protein
VTQGAAAPPALVSDCAYCSGFMCAARVASTVLTMLLPFYCCLQEASHGESSHLGSKRPAPGQSIAAGPKRSKLC